MSKKRAEKVHFSVRFFGHFIDDIGDYIRTQRSETKILNFTPAFYTPSSRRYMPQA